MIEYFLIKNLNYNALLAQVGSNFVKAKLEIKKKSYAEIKF